jgi:2-polyprenyl-3-methyl-5-hydroxy-6-metoxy-1,4-benzoquinol methylase
MFDIIDKVEYFSWLETGIADRSNHTLKGIQDAWVLSRLGDKRGYRICEVGGGNSRVLEKLAADNECWNVDRFEGFGGGPIKVTCSKRIKVVRAFMGEFSREVPSKYFDFVLSVSVVEHIPRNALANFFAARI